MNVLQFVSSLVSSLAWPLSVLGLVLLLKTPLANLLGAEQDGRRISSFKAGPSGLEIQYALDRAEADLERSQAERPALPKGDEVPEKPDEQGERQALYRTSPAAAVLEGFARLEQVLRRAVERHPGYVVNAMTRTSGRGLARHAEQLGIITESERSVIADLASIRNLVAHGDADSVIESAAERFTEIARDLTASISARTGQPGEPTDD